MTAHTRRPRTTTPEHSGDMVNHPTHYTTHPAFDGEAWGYTRHMSFALGNAFKYLWRAGAKDNMLQDLEKANWYITRSLYTEFAPRLDHNTVDQLHKNLKAWVRNCPTARTYVTGLDLNSTVLPTTTPENRTDIETVARLEAWTACVLLVQGDDRVTLAIRRAMKLAAMV